MADTAIEWADRVWNPTTGCDRVSLGCDHCYALTMAKRLKGMGSAKYQRDGDPRTSGPGFGVSTHPSTLTQPLKWRKPQRIFVNSMSDLFHDSVPDGYIGSVFDIMARAEQHTFQILTKRHSRMRSLLRKWEQEGAECVQRGELHPNYGGAAWRRSDGAWCTPHIWPLPNVHLVVSAENQQWANIRIPVLLDTPAAVRGVSLEPLLGPINLAGRGWLSPDEFDRPGIDWCITGGESGHHARPVHPDWVRSLRDQCQAAGVSFFLKQWGEWGPAVWKPERLPGETDDQYKARAEAVGATHAHTGNPLDNDTYHIYKPNHRPWSCERGQLAPGDAHAGIRRWGKKHSGRELDGRTWSEFPQQAPADG